MCARVTSQFSFASPPHCYNTFTTLQLTTIVSGVIQQRRGAIDVEDYYQPLISPQAIQLDSRQEELGLLYFSDYDTGYIYSVRWMRVALTAA